VPGIAGPKRSECRATRESGHIGPRGPAACDDQTGPGRIRCHMSQLRTSATRYIVPLRDQGVALPILRDGLTAVYVGKPMRITLEMATVVAAALGRLPVRRTEPELDALRSAAT
jgi:hypothetical protein